jgi:2-keto-4-pentenoate hydratase
MAISERTKKELAEALCRAETERKPIAPLTEAHPDLTLEEAYAIQLENVERKLREGHRVVGKKIGLTSKAMQQMLGVDQPDYGHLLDTMAVESGGEVPMDRLLQPKAEAEIAFVLKSDLQGPGLTVADVLSAVDYLVPAIEIIDSRIRDWKIKLADTIADNASSGMFVLGDSRVAVDHVDLRLMGMVLEKNGEVVLTGAGSAVLGNPAIAVAWLANKLSEFGLSLKAGEVILSGALSAAVAVAKGDAVTAHFAHLGSVGVRFT